MKIMAAENNKSSVVWQFFDVKFLDESKAVCKVCNVEISRGSVQNRRFTTSALFNHLRTRHSAELSRAENERKQSSASTQPTPCPTTVPANRKRLVDTTIEATLAKRTTWDKDHPSAVLATKYLAEMIATDLQPYSIVEDEGFIRYSHHLEPRFALPSRRRLSERIVPDMYVKVKDGIGKLMLAAKKIAFTTDIWTEGNTTKAFIGVSAHWIDSEWDRKFAVLICEQFSGRHTGEMIAVKFQAALTDWKIRNESCLVVLRDNASNMVNAFQQADIPSLGCVLHTLQLAIKDCIFDQRVVSDSLAVCRRLVGHFKHSALASQRLADIQRQLQTEILRPVQDVSTRWNSSYYMVERLLRMKQALSVLCSETDGMQDKTISPNQWSILENFKVMLEPIEKLTRDLSSYDACLSSVIPAIVGLKLTLESCDRDAGVRTMKAGLIAALDERFDGLLTNEIATCATALDPRFKLKFLRTNEVRDSVRSTVLRHALEVARQQQVNDADPSPTLQSSEPVPSTSTGGSTDVWAALDRLACGSGADPSQPQSDSDAANGTAVHAEVATYFSEALFPVKQDPLSWWKANAHRYPFLAKLAQVYLCSPPSSVQSERIFSIAGEVYDERRSRLLPENAEKLVFLKFNLPVLNFKY